MTLSGLLLILRCAIAEVNDSVHAPTLLHLKHHLSSLQVQSERGTSERSVGSVRAEALPASVAAGITAARQ